MSGDAMKVNKYKGGKTCLCRNPDECRGLTSAFVLLSDPRKGFVKLPSYKEDPPSQYYVERNQQRESYLRYLLPDHPVEKKTSTKNIALHHFHPKVTGRFLEKRGKEIPKTITEEEMAHLGMTLHERDRVVDEDGMPTGEYIFVPNYPVPKVKEDLKRMILINRMLNEAAEAQKAREEYQARQEAEEKERVQEELDREEPAEVSPLETFKEGPDAEARKILHAKLEAWEAQRREDYAVLYESTSATWRGSIDFLENGVREIARAERLVLGAALADQAFSDAMHALSHDSYLDEDGNVVTEGWKQNKILQQREDQWMPTEMLGSLVESSTRLGHKFGDAANYGNSEIASEIVTVREEMEIEIGGIKQMGDALLTEMEASEKEVLRAWYALHNAEDPESDFTVVEEIEEEGKAEEEGKFEGDEQIQEDGTSPMEEGTTDEKSAEQKLEEALSIKRSPLPVRQLSGRPTTPTDSYLQIEIPKDANPNAPEDVQSPEVTTPAQRRGFSFLQKMTERISRPTPPPGTTPLAATQPPASSPFNISGSPVSGSLRKIAALKDVWVRESLYRTAALHQAKVWHTSLGLLSKMNEVVKEIELERSVKLHAILLDFLPRERRLFLGLPAIPKPVMSKLMAERVEPQKMEENIDETLHKRSRIVLRIDNDQRSSIMNRSRCVAPDLTKNVERPLSGEAFQTDMMRYARVIERRAGVSKPWKLTLAVVTADYYLHLFDVSDIADLTPGSSPQEAYQKLLPEHEFPTPDCIVPPHSGKLLSKLTPADSVSLVNCSIAKGEDNCLEVTETIPGRFRDKATRKFFLRPQDEEMATWEDILSRSPADEVALPGETLEAIKTTGSF